MDTSCLSYLLLPTRYSFVHVHLRHKLPRVLVLLNVGYLKCRPYIAGEYLMALPQQLEVLMADEAAAADSGSQEAAAALHEEADGDELAAEWLDKVRRLQQAVPGCVAKGSRLGFACLAQSYAESRAELTSWRTRDLKVENSFVSIHWLVPESWGLVQLRQEHKTKQIVFVSCMAATSVPAYWLLLLL